jgi:hypothetical protein
MLWVGLTLVTLVAIAGAFWIATFRSMVRDIEDMADDE